MSEAARRPKPDRFLRVSCLGRGRGYTLKQTNERLARVVPMANLGAFVRSKKLTFTSCLGALLLAASNVGAVPSGLAGR